MNLSRPTQIRNELETISSINGYVSIRDRRRVLRHYNEMIYYIEDTTNIKKELEYLKNDFDKKLKNEIKPHIDKLEEFKRKFNKSYVDLGDKTLECEKLKLKHDDLEKNNKKINYECMSLRNSLNYLKNTNKKLQNDKNECDVKILELQNLKDIYALEYYDLKMKNNELKTQIDEMDNVLKKRKLTHI
jgi:hypothetical protein